MVEQLIKALTAKTRKDRNRIVESGAHLMGGLLTGIFLRDFIKILNIPIKDETIVINGRELGKAQDLFVNALSASLLAGAGFFGWKNIGEDASGVLLGYNFANKSAEGKPITQLPGAE